MLGAFLSGLVLGAFVLAVAMVAVIAAKTKGATPTSPVLRTWPHRGCSAQCHRTTSCRFMQVSPACAERKTSTSPHNRSHGARRPAPHHRSHRGRGDVKTSY